MRLGSSSSAGTYVLSLRWKVLIALSLLLLLINASLAAFAYQRSVRQFELHQSQLRDHQATELSTLLDDGFQGLSKLASFVPLLGVGEQPKDLVSHLQAALDRHGAMLGVEWDVRSVHLISPKGDSVLDWPAGSSLPQAALNDPSSESLSQSFEDDARLLHCGEVCRQYLATPLLWNKEFAGTLVLSRSLADALLTFNTLTGADVAVVVDPAQRGEAARVAMITRSDKTQPLLTAARSKGLLDIMSRPPVNVQFETDWFEIFQVDTNAPNIRMLVFNKVSEQHRAIQEVTRVSILMGILGLFLSELLLLMVMTAPLNRLHRLAGLLPMLAESRFTDLIARLPERRSGILPTDEIDVMVSTVADLTGRMVRLQEVQEASEARLAWLADHDPLTRLLNRRRFNEDFGQIVQRAVRYGHSGALLFLDLDQFKEVNDLRGHRVGDTLLQRVAEELRHCSRETDLLGRLGGDEFALVIPEADSSQAMDATRRMQDRLRSIALPMGGRRFPVSASIGIVLFPEHGTDPMSLMANGDLAMYEAKAKGHGRFHTFSLGDQARERMDARVLWRERIAQALADDRFVLYFQPIVEISTGIVHRGEALVRLRDRNGELVAPDRFIPIAEKTGQIMDIDHWVMARVIEILATQPALQVSVNLSANAMEDASLLPSLERLLARFRIPAERLTFEITETVAIDSLAHATRLMERIRQLGCRFALDDFGSGFASYAYLQHLPVDDIKIDGAFIRNLARSREDRIFVQAITDVAHGLGKRVIAEFVESEDTLAVLGDLSVDFAQGYHLGRPVPFEELDLGR